MDWEERVRMEKEFNALLADNEKLRKQLYIANKCEICCAPAGHDRQMAGGRHARMCKAHWNIWHKYCVDHEEWGAVIMAKARVDVTKNFNEPDHIEACLSYEKLQRQWFDISEQWIKDNKEE